MIGDRAHGARARAREHGARARSVADSPVGARSVADSPDRARVPPRGRGERARAATRNRRCCRSRLCVRLLLHVGEKLQPGATQIVKVPARSILNVQRVSVQIARVPAVNLHLLNLQIDLLQNLESISYLNEDIVQVLHRE